MSENGKEEIKLHQKLKWRNADEADGKIWLEVTCTFTEEKTRKIITLAEPQQDRIAVEYTSTSLLISSCNPTGFF